MVHATVLPSKQSTEFQKKVYLLCSQIPLGQFSTYLAIAKTLSSSPRAVGQALKRNPYAPKVPCHRVIASSFLLGGYNGANPVKIQEKKKLLESEGLHIGIDDVLEKKDQKCRYFNSFVV